MNVIVSNRQKDIIDNANIDAIKDLNGLFSVNDLINKFKNYFFSRMILDATSVVDFASREVLSTLANEIGAEKLIILLPRTPEPPLEFKKLLIELKIYNFTNDIGEAVKFIEKPNTYEDALKSIDDSYSSDVYVDNSIKEGEGDSNENNNNNMNVDMMNNNSNQASLGDILNSLNLNNSSMDQEYYDKSNSVPENNNIPFDNSSTVSFDNSKLEVEEKTDNEEYEASPIDYNNTMNDGMNNDTNNANNIFLINDNFDSMTNEVQEKPKKIVIGIKGVTTHAGCTSLVYMLHRMVAISLKKDVLSIEVNKNDFRLFRNSKMISVKEENLSDVINNSSESIIFVDLNDSSKYELCSQVLYLVEPSTIKLNELMATNREIFKELRDKCVLLNKSLLSPNDIRTLESEAGMHFFYNIVPLNDRIMNDTISKLLNLLSIN